MRRLAVVGAVLAVLAVGPPADAYPRPAPGPGWARYTIQEGAHFASVLAGPEADRPLAGLTRRAARRYHFIFTPSARYVITDPVEPEDQLDWNKLPGLSDCGDIDLSVNGYMFGWRWRTDLSPRVLEITAYANNDGVHLWPDDPLLTLTGPQVDARRPIWFELGISAGGGRYEFSGRGPGGPTVTTTLPRACPNGARRVRKWASGFYFGGTSPAPRDITGFIAEP